VAPWSRGKWTGRLPRQGRCGPGVMALGHTDHRLVIEAAGPVSGHMPLLVAGTAAGPYLELRPVGGAAIWVVQALAGGGVDYLAVPYLPLLVRAAPACVPLDGGAVAVVGAGDVDAAAVDLDAAVVGQGPALRGRDVIAGVELDGSSCDARSRWRW
jgi:hypothetical protein